jgi:hypothetical protein
MAIKTTCPSPDSLVFSIGAAIAEYRSRHNGKSPAYIVASMLAYTAIISGRTVRVKRGTLAGVSVPVVELFGIPVTTTTDPGYHIHLAETEIPIYEIPKEEPQVVLPPDYVPRED